MANSSAMRKNAERMVQFSSGEWWIQTGIKQQATKSKPNQKEEEDEILKVVNRWQDCILSHCIFISF